AAVHGGPVPVPGRPGQRRLAWRHHRAGLHRGHHGRDLVARGGPAAAAAPPRRRGDPALARARDALNGHYGPRLGEPLCTAGLCLYRDGRDSVAWHGDTTGRGATQDTVVAIVSLGAPRTLALRPRHGGPAIRHDLGHGDLLVMGGSCQRTWEHAVPKTTRAAGPRISVQFRPRGVR
ncbi:MAG TPA: alpha-ketoglutarate-dependent dioxygenase AlkB, partial [Streptosporangiaceae bacterium]|nr:alpha-ketoglutarate-dependent dioxygenase AlkB [Streptosporangiaceae bacterium]